MGGSDRIRKLPKSFGPPDRCFRDGGGERKKKNKRKCKTETVCHVTGSWIVYKVKEFPLR